MESYAEAIRRLKTQYPQYAQIPDDELAAKIVARYPQYKEVLTKPVPLTPGQQMAGKLQAGRPPGPLGLPSIPAPPLGLAMPPGAGFLGRTAMQGAGSALEALLGGKTAPTELAKEWAKGALFNVGSEGLMKGLGLIPRLRAGSAAQKAYEGALSSREGKISHDKALTEAVSEAEQAQFVRERATHAEQSAGRLAADIKAHVPALKGFPDTEAGLVDMVFGRGRSAVSAEFDAAFKDMAKSAKGKMVQVPTSVAERYGLTSQGTPTFLTPAVRDALQRAGKPLPPEGMTSVDAAQLAERAVGSWKKDPGAYRRAMEALDNANIGDPTARAAYKYYTGLSKAIDSTGAFKKGRFDPDVFTQGMLKLKNVEELRRRGIGSATEGAPTLMRGGPLKPPPRQVPVPPPEVAPPNVSTYRNPLAGHPWVMGAGAEALAGAAGHHGFGIPFLGGAALSQAMPKQFITGPLAPTAERILQASPQVLGPLARQYTMPIDTSAE